MLPADENKLLEAIIRKDVMSSLKDDEGKTPRTSRDAGKQPLGPSTAPTPGQRSVLSNVHTPVSMYSTKWPYTKCTRPRVLVQSGTVQSVHVQTFHV